MRDPEGLLVPPGEKICDMCLSYRPRGLVEKLQYTVIEVNMAEIYIR